MSDILGGMFEMLKLDGSAGHRGLGIMLAADQAHELENAIAMELRRPERVFRPPVGGSLCSEGRAAPLLRVKFKRMLLA